MARSFEPEDVFDPSGDTLLLLENPSTSWATGPEPEEWPDCLPQHRSLESKIAEVMMHCSFGHARIAENYEDLLQAIQRAPKEAVSAQSPEPDQTEASPSSLHPLEMRLSSKHLMLASQYFSGAFTHNYSENKAEAGFAHIVHAERWDPGALRVVMNIIHGQTQRVPRSVSLRMLAKIAAIVDYYQCHDAVRLFSDTWIQQTDLPLPSCYGVDLLLRLLVSCIFKEKVVFQQLTKLVILTSRGPITDLELPPLAQITGTNHP